MIKKFEDYCINESKEFNKERFSHDCRVALMGINNNIADEIRILISEIRKALKEKNYTKAIEQLAELKLYLINNGKNEYKYNIRKIEKVLDDVNFDDEEFDSFDYDEGNKDGGIVSTSIDDLDEPGDNDDVVKKSKFYFIREVARKYFEYNLKEKDSRLFNIFRKEERPEIEEEYELRIKEIRRFLGRNFEDVNYNILRAIESRLMDGEEYGCYYTVKDIENICRVIKNKYHNSDRIMAHLKHLLDFNGSINYKENIIEENKFNLAIGVNGKVLAGKIYYNPILGICAQTSEEMENLIDYFKKSKVYEIILDYYENIPDIDEIIEK